MTYLQTQNFNKKFLYPLINLIKYNCYYLVITKDFQETLFYQNVSYLILHRIVYNRALGNKLPAKNFEKIKSALDFRPLSKNGFYHKNKNS